MAFMANIISTNRKLEFQDFKRSELAERLGRMARICSDLNIPILIIVDGWESSGRGYVIKDLTREYAATSKFLAANSRVKSLITKPLPEDSQPSTIINIGILRSEQILAILPSLSANSDLLKS